MPACSLCVTYPAEGSKGGTGLEDLVERLRSDDQDQATGQEEKHEALAVHVAMFAERSLAGDWGLQAKRQPFEHIAFTVVALVLAMASEKAAKVVSEFEAIRVVSRDRKSGS
ncbi:MAG TPA: hypothetical protein VIK11_02070 [Tepidiformaceae bacterium]